MNLVELEDYKEAEGITSPKNDTRTEVLITSISSLIKTYCGTSFVDYYGVDKVETFNLPWAVSKIQLSECPVVSITSAEEKAAGASAFTTLDPSGYVLDTTTDTLVRILDGQEKTWETGYGTVRISYRAGYVSCPEDLKLAVYDLITYYLKDEHKEGFAMQGSTVDNSMPTANDFPPHIKRVLDLYRMLL